MSFETLSGNPLGIIFCAKCKSRTPHLPYEEAVLSWNGGAIEPSTGTQSREKPQGRSRSH